MKSNPEAPVEGLDYMDEDASSYVCRPVTPRTDMGGFYLVGPLRGWEHGKSAKSAH